MNGRHLLLSNTRHYLAGRNFKSVRNTIRRLSFSSAPFQWEAKRGVSEDLNIHTDTVQVQHQTVKDYLPKHSVAFLFSTGLASDANLLREENGHLLILRAYAALVQLQVSKAARSV